MSKLFFFDLSFISFVPCCCSLTTPQVIQRVQQLFAGHPKLISGFNQFLPDETKVRENVVQKL